MRPIAGLSLMVSALKGLGYLVSTLSVILLGIVSWQAAAEQPLLLICLIGGMAASVIGMGLRWLSHRLSEKEKQAIEARAEETEGAVGAKDMNGLRAA